MTQPAHTRPGPAAARRAPAAPTYRRVPFSRKSPAWRRPHWSAAFSSRIIAALSQAGFGIRAFDDFKPKHIEALQEIWAAKNWTPVTRQRYESALRYLLQSAGKSALMHRPKQHANGLPDLAPGFRSALQGLAERYNDKAYSKEGKVKRDASPKTRHERRNGIDLAFRELKALGVVLARPDQLGPGHIKQLVDYWVQQGHAPRTLHTRLSFMRVFAGWIGKPRMVRKLSEYVPDENTHRRRDVATVNRAWNAQAVMAEDVIAQARRLDERMALYLSLQRDFGLRVKEAIHLRPIESTLASGILTVIWGTKGGRPRTVPIDTEAQRQTIAWALRVAKESKKDSLRWSKYARWDQARTRYYYLAKKLGITKAELGVTSHGLRHQRAQAEFNQTTGQPTPIQGGDPALIDRGTYQLATLKTSYILGHGRVDVGSFYYGSHGHALRPSAAVPTVV